MRCMPARTIRMGRTTTSARAGMASRPTATTPSVTASPEARSRASRLECNTTSRPDGLAQARGGHRMMSVSSFPIWNVPNETLLFRCAAAARALLCRAASDGGVRISDGRYGLRRRQALQLGGVEENPRYLPTAADADGRGFRSVPGSPSCVLHHDDLLR